jgi:hypothetical protein
MKTTTPFFDRTQARLALGAAFMLLGACNANHVLGVGDGGLIFGSPGSAGTTGTSAGAAGATDDVAAAAGASGTINGTTGAGGTTPGAIAGCNVTPLFIGPSSKYKCSESGICHDAAGGGANFSMAAADWQSHLVGVVPKGGGTVSSICAKDPAYKNMPYIIKGDPNGDGLFLRKLQGDVCSPGGVKMPLTGNPLSATDLSCAKDWAKALAGGGAGSATGTAGTSGTTPTGTAGTSGTTPAGPKADPATLGPTESWTGYVENHMFHSGSDVIKLKFATDANGIVSGTIVFGMGTPPPPATDPNVGYPPDLLSSSAFPPGPLAWVFYVSEGYSYTFDGGSLATHRLRFTTDLTQLWAGWCALQTPAADGSGDCLPRGGGTSNGTTCALTDPNTNASVPVDCGKLWLCYSPGFDPCRCTATSCELASQSSDTAMFDVFFTGDTATGSVEGNPVSGNVHFVKD